jgi:tape measure domain-containing protein
MAELEVLIQRLQADTSQFNQALSAARGGLVSFDQAGDRTTRTMRDRFSAATATVFTLRNAFITLSGALAVRQVIAYADSYTEVQNALRVAGVGTEELSEVTTRLFDVASRTRAPIAAMADLYRATGLAATELGLSQQEILEITEVVGNALRVSGTSAQEAAGGLRQLGQALGSGRVQAEEFNGVLDGIPALAQAMARHIDGAGGSVSRLRQLIAEGAVSSRDLLEAIQDSTAELAALASTAETTVSMAMITLNNALVELAGTTDDSTGATGRLADAIEGLAETMRDPGLQWFARNVIGLLVAEVDRAVSRIAVLATTIQGLAGIVSDPGAAERDFEKFFEGPAAAQDAADRLAVLREEYVALERQLAGMAAEDPLRDQIEGRLERLDTERRALEATIEGYRRLHGLGELASERDLGARFGPPGAPETAPRPPEAPGAGAGGRPRGPMIAPAPMSREQAQSFDLEVVSTHRGGAVEYATDLDELRRAGQEAAQAQRELAEATGMTEQQFQTAMEAARIFASTASSGIVEAITAGDSLGETFQNITRSIAEAVAEMLIFQAIMAAIGGPAGPGGPATGLFGLFGGKQHGGRVERDRPYLVGEAGPELFVPQSAGRIVNNPDTTRLLSSGAGGGGAPWPGAAAGGGVNVQLQSAPVYVTNNVPNARVETEQDPQTGRIDIMIDEMMANNLRPGTSTSRALRDRFGLQFQTRR